MMNNSTVGNESEIDELSCAEFYDYFYPYEGSVIKNSVVAVCSVVACLGICGNLLVILAVLRSPQMRTPRNYFIINLAVSDLLLCSLTLPFTLHNLFIHSWPFGWFMCKALSALQAINVFASTMSITAIGLDRYLVVILVPTNVQLQKMATTLCFISVWGISVVLAIPMLFFVGSPPIEGLDKYIPHLEDCGISYQVCKEREIPKSIAAAYSVSCFLFQYCLPLFTLTFTYSKVLGQLRSRISFRKRANGGESGKVEREAKKQQKANLLVVLIIVIFAIVWLPFNVHNIVQQISPTAVTTEADQLLAKVVFASCYITAMLSACANPILYGILNSNFRYEFAKILQLARCCPQRLDAIRKETGAVSRVYHQAVAARNSIVDSVFSRKYSKTTGDVPMDSLAENSGSVRFAGRAAGEDAIEEAAIPEHEGLVQKEDDGTVDT